MINNYYSIHLAIINVRKYLIPNGIKSKYRGKNINNIQRFQKLLKIRQYTTLAQSKHPEPQTHFLQIHLPGPRRLPRASLPSTRAITRLGLV